MMKPHVIIENVVASAKVNQKIDLKMTAASFPEKAYRPGMFPELVFKMEKPKCSFLLFENGNIICTGTKSEVDARKATMKCFRELRRAGLLWSRDPEVKIRNIVAYVRLKGAMVNVGSLTTAHNADIEVMYEPEQFPAAICHMKKPEVAFLVFSTGKMICTGAKREEAVYRAVEKLMKILDENDALIRRRQRLRAKGCVLNG